MKLLKILIVLVILAGLAGAGAAGLAVWYFGRDLPDYEQLANYQPPIVTRVHAGDGRLMAEYATEKRVFVPIKAMPPLVIHAFLVGRGQEFLHPSRRRSAFDAARGRDRSRCTMAAAGGRSARRRSRSRWRRTSC